MKKIAIVFYFLATIVLLTLCVQCKKEPVCDLILRVHKTTNGLDTASALPGAFVQVGLEDNYADFAKAEGYTDKDGVFSHTFKYEALLEVKVVYDTTYYNTDSVLVREYYVGSGRVKLEPDETVDQVILVLPGV